MLRQFFAAIIAATVASIALSTASGAQAPTCKRPVSFFLADTNGRTIPIHNKCMDGIDWFLVDIIKPPNGGEIWALKDCVIRKGEGADKHTFSMSCPAERVSVHAIQKSAKCPEYVPLNSTAKLDEHFWRSQVVAAEWCGDAKTIADMRKDAKIALERIRPKKL